MKILITGASGFIGSHLVPRLAVNHEVVCLTSDLLNFDAVNQEVIKVNPDIVVHLAARTEVEKSFYEQTSFSQVNYVGTVNLIESSKQCSRLQAFVFASTMEVFGWQPISNQIKQQQTFDITTAFDEHTVPQPNAPYAVAKYACEKYLEYMYRSQGFPFCALRQTNSYGRKDNDFFVTEHIISQMIRDPKEIYLGNKEPYRNFLHIDDLIDAWQIVVENASHCCGKIFTLGPNNPIQIQNYVSLIAAKLQWSGTVHWNTKPPRHGEIYWLNSNHNLITNTLGWQPKVSLNQGIDQTIAIWKDNLPCYW